MWVLIRKIVGPPWAPNLAKCLFTTVPLFESRGFTYKGGPLGRELAMEASMAPAAPLQLRMLKDGFRATPSFLSSSAKIFHFTFIPIPVS